MKLKKIASLALAGIIAVSMLTACDTTSNNQPNVPNQPEEPTASDVVSAVEAGIKSWNSDLEIDVKSSNNMDAAIEKVFDYNTNWKTLNTVIDGSLKYVFGLNDWGTVKATGYKFNDPSFITNNDMVNFLNNKSASDELATGDTVWSYAIVEVTKASGDANVAAGNVIGEALQNLQNTVDVQNIGSVANKYTHMNVDYTMYVTSEDAVMANNSTVTYVIAVLKADYSAVV